MLNASTHRNRRPLRVLSQDCERHKDFEANDIWAHSFASIRSIISFFYGRLPSTSYWESWYSVLDDGHEVPKEWHLVVRVICLVDLTRWRLTVSIDRPLSSWQSRRVDGFNITDRLLCRRFEGRKRLEELSHIGGLRDTKVPIEWWFFLVLWNVWRTKEVGEAIRDYIGVLRQV